MASRGLALAPALVLTAAPVLILAAALPACLESASLPPPPISGPNAGAELFAYGAGGAAAEVVATPVVAGRAAALPGPHVVHDGDRILALVYDCPLAALDLVPGVVTPASTGTPAGGGIPWSTPYPLALPPPAEAYAATGVRESAGWVALPPLVPRELASFRVATAPRTCGLLAPIILTTSATIATGQTIGFALDGQTAIVGTRAGPLYRLRVQSAPVATTRGPVFAPPVAAELVRLAATSTVLAAFPGPRGRVVVVDGPDDGAEVRVRALDPEVPDAPPGPGVFVPLQALAGRAGPVACGGRAVPGPAYAFAGTSTTDFYLLTSKPALHHFLNGVATRIPLDGAPSGPTVNVHLLSLGPGAVAVGLEPCPGGAGTSTLATATQATVQVFHGDAAAGILYGAAPVAFADGAPGAVYVATIEGIVESVALGRSLVPDRLGAISGSPSALGVAGGVPVVGDTGGVVTLLRARGETCALPGVERRPRQLIDLDRAFVALFKNTLSDSLDPTSLRIAIYPRAIALCGALPSTR